MPYEGRPPPLSSYPPTPIPSRSLRILQRLFGPLPLPRPAQNTQIAETSVRRCSTVTLRPSHRAFWRFGPARGWTLQARRGRGIGGDVSACCDLRQARTESEPHCRRCREEREGQFLRRAHSVRPPGARAARAFRLNFPTPRSRARVPCRRALVLHLPARRLRSTMKLPRGVPHPDALAPAPLYPPGEGVPLARGPPPSHPPRTTDADSVAHAQADDRVDVGLLWRKIGLAGASNMVRPRLCSLRRQASTCPHRLAVWRTRA